MAVPLTNMSFFQLSPSKEQCHEPLVQLSFIFELSSFTVLLSRRAHLHELWNLRYFSAIFPLTPLHLKKNVCTTGKILMTLPLNFVNDLQIKPVHLIHVNLSP